MYFTTTKLKMTSYSYVEHSSIEFKLKISTTICRPVDINPCELSRLCRRLQCKDLLQRIGADNNILLKEQPENDKHLLQAVQFSILSGDCVVFQVSNQINLSFTTGIPGSKCQFELRTMPALEPSVAIFFEIIGFSHRYNHTGLSNLATHGQIDFQFTNFKSPNGLERQSFVILSPHSNVNSLSMVWHLMEWSRDWFDVSVWWNVSHKNKLLDRNLSSPAQIIHYGAETQGIRGGKNEHQTLSLDTDSLGDRINFVLNYQETVPTFVTMDTRKPEFEHSPEFWCQYYIKSQMWFLPNHKGISFSPRFFLIGLDIKIIPLGSTQNSSLKATWLPDFGVHTDDYATRPCKNTPLLGDYMFCMFIHTATRNNPNAYKNHVLFRRSIRHKFAQKSELRSWQTASNQCARIGGYLPMFYSRRNLRAFMLMMKVTYSIVPMEAMYVGFFLTVGTCEDIFDKQKSRCKYFLAFPFVFFQNQQQHYKWQDNSPAGYQLWENTFFQSAKLLYYVAIFIPGVHCSFAKENCSMMYDTPDISHVKQHANQTLMPDLHSDKLCTIMMVANLADPEWININCDEKILGDILCQVNQPRPREHKQIKTLPEMFGCSKTQIRNGDYCFEFLWLGGENHDPWARHMKHLHNALDLCKNIQMKPAQVDDLVHLKPLAKSTNAIFPHIILLGAQGLTVYFYQPRESTFIVQRSNIVQNGTCLLCKGQTRQHSALPSTMLLCSSGGYISADNLCDGKIDCTGPRGDDELYCGCSPDCFIQQPLSKETQAKFGTRKCGPLYKALVINHSKKDLKCVKFKKIFQNEDMNKTNNNRFQDALVPDELSFQDEKHLIKLLAKETHYNCHSSAQLSCKQGHSKCFNISDICQYRLDSDNNLTPCRTGGHLEECETFQCNNMFKCPEYHCTPFGYLCDGKWDCPMGHDESDCFNNRSCSGFYICGQSHGCIHLADRCDGYVNCPLGEDEHFCDLFKVQCPTLCTCLMYAVSCLNSVAGELTHISNFQNYLLISFQNCSLEDTRFLWKAPNSVSFLKLKQNMIEEFCGTTHFWPNVVSLDLSFNWLVILTSECFSDHFLVRCIDISNNKLVSIRTHAFHNLPSLSVLNLSSNSITTLQTTFIHVSLKGISPDIPKILLQDNSFERLNRKIFDGIIPLQIEVDDYRVCWVVRSVSECIVEFFCEQIKSCLNVPSKIAPWSSR